MISTTPSRHVDRKNNTKKHCKEPWTREKQKDLTLTTDRDQKPFTFKSHTELPITNSLTCWRKNSAWRREGLCLISSRVVFVRLNLPAEYRSIMSQRERERKCVCMCVRACVRVGGWGKEGWRKAEEYITCNYGPIITTLSRLVARCNTLHSVKELVCVKYKIV